VILTLLTDLKSSGLINRNSIFNFRPFCNFQNYGPLSISIIIAGLGARVKSLTVAHTFSDGKSSFLVIEKVAIFPPVSIECRGSIFWITKKQ